MNEMTNQAAQTMPSLVDRVRECHAAWAAYNAVAPGEDRAVGTEKLLTEVLAALSQPAGVVEGWMRDVADAAAALDKRGDRQMAARLMRLHRDMLAAAPAASVVQRLRDAIEGECDGLGITEESAESILRYIGFHPQGRIVGGREIDGVWVIEATSHSDLMPNQQLVRYDDYRRALEQALTQQRGEPVAWRYVHVIDGDSGSWQPMENLTPAYRKRLTDDGCEFEFAYAATIPQPSAGAVREVPDGMEELREKIEALQEFKPWAHKNTDSRKGFVTSMCKAKSPEEGEEYGWVNKGTILALLSAATDHQQNAAQGGGEK